MNININSLSLYAHNLSCSTSEVAFYITVVSKRCHEAMPAIPTMKLSNIYIYHQIKHSLNTFFPSSLYLLSDHKVANMTTLSLWPVQNVTAGSNCPIDQSFPRSKDSLSALPSFPHSLGNDHCSHSRANCNPHSVGFTRLSHYVNASLFDCP